MGVIEANLSNGLTELGLSVTAETQTKLLEYLHLMEKWNRVYNLTAVRRIEDMVSTHLLDSLAITLYTEGAKRILDVGTGPGLPGIPLSLISPGTQVTLLDSNHKKTTFLKQAITMLGLTNAKVVCERVEKWQTPERFDFIVSRAFSNVTDFLDAAGRLVTEAGILIAMKGVYPEEELKQIPAGFELKQVMSLKVPGVVGERHLVLFSKLEVL